ncbi:MAG: PleD family two-component system response regulator [Bdellovibrionales bacterium]
MALKVLLADESTTIKKVIELSLQDYSVEIKNVSLGVDVLDVAKQIQPNLILVDILLQKKNGYEVCHEIKNNPETKDIPVVILWSGFMELDDSKMKICGADDAIEKPFEAEQLRSLVKRLVPGLEEANPLMAHVEIPDVPTPHDFTRVMSLSDVDLDAPIGGETEELLDDSETPPPVGFISETTKPAPQASDSSTEEDTKWDMQSFEELPEIPYEEPTSADSDEEFKSLNLQDHQLTEESDAVTQPGIEIPEAKTDEEEGSWVSQKLGKFQLDIPSEEEDFDALTNLDVPEQDEEIRDTSFLWSPNGEPAAPSAPEDSKAEEVSADPVSEPEPFSEEQTPEEVTPEVEEISLSATADHDFEIEHNTQLGVEVIDDFEPMQSTSSPTQENKIDYNQLPVDKINELVDQLVKERVEHIVQKLLPDLAKESIEREIKRLLDSSNEY